MKLALHSLSFFSSAIQTDLLPPGTLSGETFVVSGCVGTGHAPQPFFLTNNRSSEIQTAGRLAPVCRIGTFGAADGAMALSDEFIEVDGFATTARKSTTPARKSATAARKSATAARKSAMAARNSAMATRNSAMAARNSAMAARNSAMAARNSAMAARNSATHARNSTMAVRKSATTARKAATGAVRVTTEAGPAVYTVGGCATLITVAAVRHGSGDFNDEPLVTRGAIPVQQFDSNNLKGELT
jgi:hypothetical protein